MDGSHSSQSLHHRASEQTLISLLELDPSPIDSPTPSDEKQLYLDDSDTIMAASADSASFGTTTAPGLGSHSSIFYRTAPLLSFGICIYTHQLPPP